MLAMLEIKPAVEARLVWPLPDAYWLLVDA